MNTQLHEHTENQQTVHRKWVDYILCEFQGTHRKEKLALELQVFGKKKINFESICIGRGRRILRTETVYMKLKNMQNHSLAYAQGHREMLLTLETDSGPFGRTQTKGGGCTLGREVGRGQFYLSCFISQSGAESFSIPSFMSEIFLTG